MKIEGNVKTDDFLRIDDLEDGEVFIFKDNPNNVLLKACDSKFEVVDLKTGELYELTYEEEIYRAVERVKCKLVIE